MIEPFQYRIIPLSELHQEHYFSLYAKVYKNASTLLRRWQWEYLEHPLSEAFRIIIAEDKGRLIAATTRLPFDIKIHEHVYRAYFSVDSMVDPDYRRKGIMEELYAEATKTMPLLYSKNAMPGMYRLLMKFGYQPIVPNTSLVCYLRPIELALNRINIFLPNSGRRATFGLTKWPDYTRVNAVGPEFEIFWRNMAPKYPSLVVKDRHYMNWRYIKIPHKQYDVFYRRQANGAITSVVVLRVDGRIGKIVDLLWDPDDRTEPEYTLSFSKDFFKSQGCAKAICWCTYQSLRHALKKRFFVDRGETPQFSVYSTSMDIPTLANGSRFHFVGGDGDGDYL